MTVPQDFSEESLQFMSKVLHRSGLGDETYAPPSLTQVPMQLTMTAARQEFEVWCAAIVVRHCSHTVGTCLCNAVKCT